jgi:hypothetical protein
MLVTAFEEVASSSDLAVKNNSLVTTKTTNRELKIDLNFKVVRKGDNGIGVKLVPSGPDIDSISSSPALGSSKQRTGDYKISLKIPLITAQTSDPRRILHGSIGSEKVLIIDRPYTLEWWKKLSAMIPITKTTTFGIQPQAQPGTDEHLNISPVIMPVEPEFSY